MGGSILEKNLMGTAVLFWDSIIVFGAGGLSAVVLSFGWLFIRLFIDKGITVYSDIPWHSSDNDLGAVRWLDVVLGMVVCIVFGSLTREVPVFLIPIGSVAYNDGPLMAPPPLCSIVMLRFLESPQHR